MRSLFSGVSGLKVHQTKMDVIGNNISNVNTVGFKGSSVTFSDIFYQTTQSAAGPNAQTGSAGRNAMQIGLGSNLASITANITGQGGSQRTDNPLDVMINGDSFFIVNSGGTNYFTKAGAFQVDAAGTLCTPSGATVMGWQVNADGTDINKDVVTPLRVMSPDKLTAPPEATTEAYFVGNLDSNDSSVQQTATGYNATLNFYDDLGNLYTAKFTTKLSTGANASKNEFDVVLSDIVNATNQKSIFVSSTTDANGNVTYAAVGQAVSFAGQNYTVAVDAATGAVTLSGTAAKLTFNADTGVFTSITGGGAAAGADNKKATLSVTGTGANGFQPVNIDFSNITKYSSGGTSSMEPFRGEYKKGAGAGKSVGDMIGISIDPTGKIYGSYDNGDKLLLGQIAVASFANPSGLEAVGNNMFQATQNSGDFDGIGKDPTTGGGSLSTGILEMSNVDLSTEFTTMITTQRGFQANSRIITTSDTLLEELINLKR